MSDVGVSELFRFRLVRPINQVRASATAYVISDQSPAVAPVPPLTTVLGTYGWLLPLSASLAVDADYVTPQQLTGMLPQNWATQVTSATWGPLRNALHAEINMLAVQCRDIPPNPASYNLAVVPPPLASSVEEACRILLIYDLITTLQANPAALQTAQDVQTALTFRNVVLPRAP